MIMSRLFFFQARSALPTRINKSEFGRMNFFSATKKAALENFAQLSVEALSGIWMYVYLVSVPDLF